MTPPPDSNGIAGGVDVWRVALSRIRHARSAMDGGSIAECRRIAEQALATTPDPTTRTGEEAMREAAARVADRLAESWDRRAGETQDETRALLCREIAQSHRLNAAETRALPLPGDAS